MYINIRTRLFTEDPANRFAIFFKCQPEVWRKVWYRYKILGYTKGEAREYLGLILKIPIKAYKFDRWVDRTELYLKAQDAVKLGAEKVDSSFFGNYKTFVENEVTKNK